MTDRKTLTVDERRNVTIPVPSDVEVLNRLINALRDAANQGFEIVAASARDNGNQRDPETVAVVLSLRKPSR